MSWSINFLFATTSQNTNTRTFLAGAAFLADCFDGVLAILENWDLNQDDVL
jgi:hypothetical protein